MSKAILDEQNKRKETLMNDERREYIRDQLYQETGDPESQAWRDELTPEEMEYVERLDGRYVRRHSGAGEGPGAVPAGGDREAGDHPGPLPGDAAGWRHVPGTAGPRPLPAAG